MPPASLKNRSDYFSALLWLMGELYSAPRNAVMAEFKRCFKDLIPEDQYEQNSSGTVKWVLSVLWTHHDLQAAGLIDSGGKGIWMITDAGRQWLRDYPDGGDGKMLHTFAKKQLEHKKEKAGRETSPSRKASNDRMAHQRLDELLKEICQFVAGKTTARPSDEQLCDWVYLCYLFGRYEEGQELFSLIVPAAVDPLFYSKAKRFAQTCRLKASFKE